MDSKKENILVQINKAIDSLNEVALLNEDKSLNDYIINARGHLSILATKMAETKGRSNPKSGDLYKHFKGDYYWIYQIATNADNSSNQNEVVVYISRETGKFYVRDLVEFMSEVDKEKYPNATQKYRFEKVILSHE